MKPWEETWRANPLDGREVECPSPELPDDDAYRIAEAYMGSEDGTHARFDRARFIAAAPDMARALLSLLATTQHWVLLSGPCDEARAALRKAGVPLP